jgi:hypothetical protein
LTASARLAAWSLSSSMASAKSLSPSRNHKTPAHSPTGQPTAGPRRPTPQEPHKRSDQGLCETCRRGESSPKYTRPLERRTGRRVTRNTWSARFFGQMGRRSVRDYRTLHLGRYSVGPRPRSPTLWAVLSGARNKGFRLVQGSGYAKMPSGFRRSGAADPAWFDHSRSVLTAAHDSNGAAYAVSDRVTYQR